MKILTLSLVVIFLSTACSKQMDQHSNESVALAHPNFDVCILAIGENEKNHSCIGSREKYSGDFTVSNSVSGVAYHAEVVHAISSKESDNYRIRVFRDAKLIEEFKFRFEGKNETIFTDSNAEILFRVPSS